MFLLFFLFHVEPGFSFSISLFSIGISFQFINFKLSRTLSDSLTEWIKGLLAVPFVLHSQPTGVFETRSHTVEQMAELAHRRYAEIMLDVERMIDDHSTYSSFLSHLLAIPSI